MLKFKSSHDHGFSSRFLNESLFYVLTRRPHLSSEDRGRACLVLKDLTNTSTP